MATGGRGSSNPKRFHGSDRLGAIPKTPRSSTQSNNETWRRGPTTHAPIKAAYQGKNKFRAENTSRLDFECLRKLTNDKVEPAKVIRYLGDPKNDLSTSLKENSGNVEYLELVIIALGDFCAKSGTSQFTDDFLKIVRILANQKVFAQMTSVFVNISQSRTRNLGTKEERIQRLTRAVYHLAIDILVIAPAFGCDMLGEHFFEDILFLKTMPSIRGLNILNAFDILEKGIDMLKSAWSQHIPKKQDKENFSDENFNNDSHFGAEEPPDNFRSLSILPTYEDICVDVLPFLRPNIVRGAYPDEDTYLDIQFRLLREDLFQPLRTGLLAYKKQDNRKIYRNPDNIRLYYEVKIVDYEVYRDVYTITFSTRNLKRINWENSKRFLHGSLLCLSPDHFTSLLVFTVVERDPRLLSQGTLKVKYEGEELRSSDKKKTFTMAESAVFYEAYRSVLSALQRVNPIKFPLKDFILGRKSTPEVPGYLALSNEVDYDMTCVQNASSRDIAPLKRVPIIGANACPKLNCLGLDPSQRDALYAALTQKVSVIQGPPGTGKTYVGLRIVEILLANKGFWSRGSPSAPILVICYTNHALDQFLEGIIKFTDKVVRIGGRSKCTAMENYSLMKWKQKRRVSSETSHWISSILREIEEAKSKSEYLEQLRATMSNRGIINHTTLLKMGVIPNKVHVKFSCLMAKLPYNMSRSLVLGWWLGIYSNEVLQNLIDYFQRFTQLPPQNGAKSTESMDRISNTETEAVEEEWDKEHLIELEANRKEIDEEDLFDQSMKVSTKINPDLVDIFKRSFCYLFSSTEEDIQKHLKQQEEYEGEDLEWIQRTVEGIKTRLVLLDLLLRIVPPMKESELENLYNFDLLIIPYPQRWRMYSNWKRKALTIVERNIEQKEKEFRNLCKTLKDVRTKESAEISRSAEVVGFTTSGAAKQRSLLDHLKPKIVIVEEAAEVLEAHVVCALSDSCQQLILIGDHQQLRPSVAVHKLAREFALDVSLFERLIKNGMEHSTLKIQHRMRPEIARLIVPLIYPQLENHSSVLTYPNVRGMVNNVFFLAHNEHERQDSEGKSHLNPYEAELSLVLAGHLIKQGYEPSQITILTTYSGQLLHFWKVRNGHPAVRYVRICVVDNFQGEENDIIILSLVRSNPDDNIGFLRIENRICVALSRAKQGFFIIGNMESLEGKSKLWSGISRILESNNQIGSHFNLKCENHDVVTKARVASDFPPGGGCMQMCSAKMPCGHACPQICHATDRSHETVRCQKECTRFCDAGHACKKKCYEECGNCFVKVLKTLPCSHEQKVGCYKNTSKVLCRTTVWKILPKCGHGLDMFCGVHPEMGDCRVLCEEILDCGHTCPKICHKDVPHSEVPCEQPCRRLCVNQHACNKQCNEDCGQCHTKMMKLLPCGHEAEVECHMDPQSVFCNVKIQKNLPNCEHTVEIECSTPTTGFKCTRACEKIMCEYGHPCKKSCCEPCGKCFVRMPREFSCGHTSVMECYVDATKIKCRVPKECVLPACGHRVTIGCGIDPDDASCSLPCNLRLDCGHTCTLTCHVKNDPDHEKYVCKKRCAKIKRGCKLDHKCAKQCFEECDTCNIQWNRTLPCGHTAFTECHRNDDEIDCAKPVKKVAECGHQMELPCSTQPERKYCKQKCETVLSCGHVCQKRCGDPCTESDCEELVKTLVTNICGHAVTLACKDFQNGGGIPNEDQTEFHLANCKNPCDTILNCEHPCSGTCGECFNGRLHRSCSNKCGRSLICGHICNVDCAQSCPPCNRKCSYFCNHSKCNHKCSELCSPCQERCEWKCKHAVCTKKCGERCDRQPCDEPCEKVLACGHSCIGLCGEPCPPLCRLCDKDKLTEFVLLGNEENEDAKFVFLPSCEHCIEVEGMDMWIETGGNGEIQQKCCPRCKTPLGVCTRYGNAIKSTYSDIAKVKQKLLQVRGNPSEFFNKAASQMTTCAAYLEKLDWSTLIVTRLIHEKLSAISVTLKPKTNGKNKRVHPSLASDQRFLIEVTLDLLERFIKMLVQIYVGPDSKTPHDIPMRKPFEKKFCNCFFNLVSSLTARTKITFEDYRAFLNEVDRLDYVRAYFMLKSATTFPVVGSPSSENVSIQRLLMKNVKVLDATQKIELKKALDDLAKKLRTGIGITSKELADVLKGMAEKEKEFASKGHWFKCPNGHIYAIGECGGATQQGVCNECGAIIGGSSHRIRQDNSLASEMDGANAPAWPQ